MVSLSNHTVIYPPVAIGMVTLTTDNENPVVGDAITFICSVVLDPAVDSDVRMIAEYFGPARTFVDTRPTDPDSDGIYKSASTLPYVRIVDSGTYRCTVTAISSDTFVAVSDPVSDTLMVNVGKECGLKDMCNICRLIIF